MRAVRRRPRIPGAGRRVRAVQRQAGPHEAIEAKTFGVQLLSFLPAVGDTRFGAGADLHTAFDLRDEKIARRELRSRRKHDGSDSVSDQAAGIPVAVASDSTEEGSDDKHDVSTATRGRIDAKNAEPNSAHSSRGSESSSLSPCADSPLSVPLASATNTRSEDHTRGVVGEGEVCDEEQDQPIQKNHQDDHDDRDTLRLDQSPDARTNATTNVDPPVLEDDIIASEPRESHNPLDQLLNEVVSPAYGVTVSQMQVVEGSLPDAPTAPAPSRWSSEVDLVRTPIPAAPLAGISLDQGDFLTDEQLELLLNGPLGDFSGLLRDDSAPSHLSPTPIASLSTAPMSSAQVDGSDLSPSARFSRVEPISAATMNTTTDVYLPLLGLRTLPFDRFELLLACDRPLWQSMHAQQMKTLQERRHKRDRRDPSNSEDIASASSLMLAVHCFADGLLVTGASFMATLLVCRFLPLFATFAGDRNYFAAAAVCFSLAAANFSLIKSPLPDGASSRHDFNPHSAFTRSLYATLLALGVLLSGRILDLQDGQIWPRMPSPNPELVHVYGVGINYLLLLTATRAAFLSIIPALPLLHMFGLLPQWNTLTLFVLEQISMHALGSSGQTNIANAVLDIGRSVFFCILPAFLMFRSASRTHFLGTSGGVLACSSLADFTASSGVIVGIAWIAMCSFANASVPPEAMSLKVWYPVTRALYSSANYFKYLATACVSAVSSFPSKKSTAVELPSLDDDGAFSASERKRVRRSNRQDSLSNDLDSYFPWKRFFGIPLASAAVFFMSALVVLFISSRPVDAAFVRVPAAGCPEPKLIPQTTVHIGYFLVAVLAASTGVVAHFFFPALRRPYPFGIFSESILSTPEADAYDAPDAPAVWQTHERIRLAFVLAHDSIFVPLSAVIAVASSAARICLLFGASNGFVERSMISVGCMIFSVIATRIMRGVWQSRGWMWSHVLIFALLYFNCDFGDQVPGPFSVPSQTAAGNWVAVAFSFTSSYLVGSRSESSGMNLFVSFFLVAKLHELVLKAKFAVTYLSPIHIPASGLHALQFLVGIPHTMLLVVQLVFSSLLSLPLMPMDGSAWFIISYGRPLKFWEKEYRTHRQDAADRRLTDTIDRSDITEQNSLQAMNNLNSVFYEHMVESLRLALRGEMDAGRFGAPPMAGDFFLLVNDRLTMILHIIATGNGYVTFQLRGMEFKGTYCQEQELAEIMRDDFEDKSRERWFLPWKSAFQLRHHAWHVANAGLMLKSYSIALNPAATIFSSFTSRKTLVRLFVSTCLYFALLSPALRRQWMPFLKTSAVTGDDEDDRNYLASYYARYPVADAAQKVLNSALDVDPLFTKNLDADYDDDRGGISLAAFKRVYGGWIAHVLSLRTALFPLESRKRMRSARVVRRRANSSRVAVDDDDYNDDREDSGLIMQRDPKLPSGDESQDERDEAELLIRFGYLLSLVARRVLLMSSSAVASYPQFLGRLHAVLKGDVRPTSTKDEWVFADPQSFLDDIIGRSARLSLRLHQETFIYGDEELLGDHELLSDTIEEITRDFVVCHEQDPRWRRAILNNQPDLLSLRSIGHRDDTQPDNPHWARGDLPPTAADESHVMVTLKLRHLRFRCIKINSEAVRGLWAAQQQELVYFGNTNPERGSIQNLKTVLRNLVNQSCDFPVGYPVFVSALATSYASVWPDVMTQAHVPQLLTYSCAPQE